MQSIKFAGPSHLTTWMERGVQAIYNLIVASHPLVFAVSGGKDSTVTTIIGLEAIRRARQAGIVQAQHYVTTANTTVENPAMFQHLLRFLDDVSEYCERHELDVVVKIAQPSLASQFVVSTIGRGTLARTNQNSVKDGKSQRSCSTSWKVLPQIKLKKELEANAIRYGFKEPVTILGTRRSESSVRSAKMLERGESAAEVLRGATGDLTYSPIADWQTDDVWWMLSQFTDEAAFPFPSPVSARTINRMHDLYREANDGMCGVVLGEEGQRKSCGSRFGCSLCLMSGEQDKSMESLVKEPKHVHLEGLNRFRNYLIATQWDLSLRELVGRTISPAGYLRVQADTYSYEHRMSLLRMLLTLDALEIERAERHTEDLHAGIIEDNVTNRELCDVQFEMINSQQLVAIDFQLGMHHYCTHAFPALSAWYEVHELGRRHAIPSVIDPVQKGAIPLHGWFKVGNFDASVPTDGLRSYESELWNSYLNPGRPSSYAVTPEGDRVCYFEESDVLSVDPVDANLMVNCEFKHLYLDAQRSTGLESSRFWLNKAFVKLPKGKAGIYNHMAKRGQYFAHLADRLNFSPAELDEYLIKHSISNSAHDALLVAKNKSNSCLPLFDQVEAQAQQSLVF